MSPTTVPDQPDQGGPRNEPDTPVSGPEAVADLEREAWAAIADALVEARRPLGLTQASHARVAGVAQSATSEVERGHGRVSMRTLVRLAAAVGLRVRLTRPDHDACIPGSGSGLADVVPMPHDYYLLTYDPTDPAEQATDAVLELVGQASGLLLDIGAGRWDDARRRLDELVDTATTARFHGRAVRR